MRKTESMKAERADKSVAEEVEELRRRVAELESAEHLRAGGGAPSQHPDFFRLLLEKACELILVLSRDAGMRYASPAALPMTGYPPQELLSMKPFEFVHPDDLPLVRERFSAGAAEPGRAVRARFRFRRKDGSCFEAEAVARNLLDDPVVAGIVVNLRDAGVLGGEEGAAGAREERYRFLVENLQGVVLALDIRGNVLYISPVVERISQYAVEDLTGLSFMRFIHPDDLHGFMQSFHRLLAGAGDPCEFRMVDKGGTFFYVQFSGRRFEEKGGAAGLVGVMSEITERKQADEARKRSEEHFRAIIRRNINYSRGSQS